MAGVSGVGRAAAAAMLVAGLATAAPAIAQESLAARITLGLGPSISPDYFGSEDYSLGATGTLRFNYLRLPGGVQFGDSDFDPMRIREGFGLRGSFRYIGSRTAADNPALAGLQDVDRSVELGLGVAYETRDWRAFADARYGVIGHNAWVGELGADALFQPGDRWIVNVGPRLGLGSQRFMDTYFGVSPEEAAASELPAFSPSSGVYSVGAEVGARYFFSERWGVEGAVTYDRLVDDAGDSPIVGLGSRDQFGARVMVTRSISLGF